MRLRASCLLLLLAATGARAACDEALLDRHFAALQPSHARDSRFSSCRQWPMHPDRVLLVLARRTPASANPDDGFAVNVDVVVADAASGERLGHYALPEAIESDAYRLWSIDLDTARYRLAPGVDAFGLRMEHGGSSSVNPSADTQLHLFAWDGRRLRRVLDGWPVRTMHGENNGGACGRDHQSTTATLAISARSTHGYADLQVAESLEIDHAIEDAYGCHEATTTVPMPGYSLTFDGEAYGLHPKRD
jgi:hypothetical protein